MRIKIETLASDTDMGTESHAVGSEADAQDWLLNAVGEDRDELEAWAAKGGHDPDVDFWDFMAAHQGHLDTFSWGEAKVDVDLCAQPLPDSDVAKAREAVECLQRARDLLKASRNLQTLKRVEAALSGAKGAVRINEGRAVKAQLETKGN